MEQKFSKYLKETFGVIKYSPKAYFGNLICETYIIFQTIFVAVIIANIITAIESSNTENVWFWAYVFLISTILMIISTIIEDLLRQILDGNIHIGLANKYLKQFTTLDNTKVETFGTGKFSNIIFKGCDSIYHMIEGSLGLIPMVLGIIYVFVLVILKVPNIYYLIFFAVSFVIIIFLYTKGMKYLWEIRKASKEITIEIDRTKVKILMSKFEIQQNNKIEQELEKIKHFWIKDTILRVKGTAKKNIWQGSGVLIGKIYYFLVFVIIGIGIITGKYQMATFMLLLWLLENLLNYTWQIRNKLKDLSRTFIDIEKLVDTFEEIPKYKDDSNLPDFNYKNGDIELKKISFCYNENFYILKDFSLKLEGGKKYAFVGQSGGGKTTLVKLLTQYIIPTSGKIIIDEQNLEEVNLKSYYKNIGYLSQEPNVFDGTIMENLVYALDYEPKYKEIEEVIKLSKSEFIYDLPKGLETEIGEKGVKLSGGQKQRLAIAKIMLKNPHIILLDEPTSALDSFNEEEITEALKNLFKGKTTIIIAHRLQTVKNADQIFYVENGKIIEQGTHKELLKLRGKYYNMIELQSGF